MKVLVFGGYGTFGSLVSRELAARNAVVTIAGRDKRKAETFARELGDRHRGIAADVGDATSCREAIADHAVVANCAGPFQHFDATLLEVCLETGCHYVDIADDRDYCATVRKYHDDFVRRQRAAVYGCSSLPAISGALALLPQKDRSERPNRARVTLFIGNNNPKGGAAIRSLVGSLGKPIPAPQGVLHCFRGREVVPLPPPIGRRAAFDFTSPEYDLFPDLLGVSSVSVKVVFELRLSNFLFAALALLGQSYGECTARLLERVGGSIRWGTSSAAIMTELFYPDGSTARATFYGHDHGQRLAALPCALAALSLCKERSSAAGAMTCYDLLGAEKLVRDIQEAGFDLIRDGSA
jgi:short subunit dehydrogenase-like uncharacterized protein